MQYPVENCKNLLSMIIIHAIKDYDSAVKRGPTYSTASAKNYLLNGNFDTDISFFNINITGKEVSKRIENGSFNSQFVEQLI